MVARHAAEAMPAGASSPRTSSGATGQSMRGAPRRTARCPSRADDVVDEVEGDDLVVGVPGLVRLETRCAVRPTCATGASDRRRPPATPGRRRGEPPTRPPASPLTARNSSGPMPATRAAAPMLDATAAPRPAWATSAASTSHRQSRLTNPEASARAVDRQHLDVAAARAAPRRSRSGQPSTRHAWPRPAGRGPTRPRWGRPGSRRPPPRSPTGGVAGRQHPGAEPDERSGGGLAPHDAAAGGDECLGIGPEARQRRARSPARARSGRARGPGDVPEPLDRVHVTDATRRSRGVRCRARPDARSSGRASPAGSGGRDR